MGLMAYLATGLTALLLAAWISTQFLGRAHSQDEGAQAQAPAEVPAQTPPQQIPQQIPQQVPQGTTSPIGMTRGNNPLSGIIEDYTYDPRGKRDPFLPFERPPSSSVLLGPLWPLQRFDLDQLKLVGIIWDVKSPKAMILDPSGKGYVVKVNERIGRNNGYIARIREGEIIIVESVTGVDGKLNYTTKLMKLSTTNAD